MALVHVAAVYGGTCKDRGALIKEEFCLE